ncbi:hypothetical protein [Primorskyibacter sp. 2E233]|uniref:hypothetical protein n=1 Tax=Primorskyibacter sp. 2E233 TaxID=3413431 RepID=UPI003BF3D07D
MNELFQMTTEQRLTAMNDTWIRMAAEEAHKAGFPNTAAALLEMSWERQDDATHQGRG